MQITRSQVHRPAGILMGVALGALTAGCGKGDIDREVSLQTGELNQVHEIYMMYVKNNQKPPRRIADLKRYDPMYPSAFLAVREGKYNVVWGVSAKDPGTVLAYEKDASTQGGAMLMADGTVKQVSADEFQAVAKK